MAREQYYSHDHILAVQVHGESPKPWAATEFTDGGTLADYFDADLDASQWFAHGLVRAVSHAHALGVVHGGLCPPAVRFSTSLGSTWPAPKIGDWGLAVVVMDECELPGSHSMGRQPPFSGEPHVVAGQITTDDPPTPTERNPNLPEEVDTVLSHSLAKRKQARYETVDDLIVALGRCTDAISV